MEIQTLSLAMSQHLSSLASGFEGHWVYVYWGTSKTTSIYCRSAWGITAFPENGDKIICPAWQAEDVLRNLKTLAPYIKHQDPVPVEIFFKPKVTLQEYTICCNHSIKEYVLPWEIMVSELTSLLVMYPDTAYQKIEEYLWTVLK